MNRTEALHLLGLDADATPDEIKEAYRETVQILHPDRFAGNKKLEARATEQFKNLQDAYDVLMKGVKDTKGAKGSSGARGSGRASRATESAAGARAQSWTKDEDGVEVEYVTEAEIRARLAGISAARAQLVAEKDLILDQRRNSIIFAVAGAIVAAITVRRPFGIFGAIASIASAACVYGVISLISHQRNINVLDDHLKELAEQRKEYETLLDE